MSAEKLSNNTEINKNHTTQEIRSIPKGITVDINVLRLKLKDAKKKEKNGNYIFLGLVCSAVAITGVIASF
jgi:hypothetical protein